MIRFVAVTPKGGKVRDYPVIVRPGRWKVETPFGNRNLWSTVGANYYIYLPGGGLQIGRLRVKAGSERHG